MIDYAQEDFTRGDVRYDFIFDVPGNRPLSACLGALTPDGRYVLIGHERYGVSGTRALGLFPRFFALMFRSLFVKRLRLGRSSIPTRQDAMAILRQLLEDGKITDHRQHLPVESDTRGVPAHDRGRTPRESDHYSG